LSGDGTARKKTPGASISLPASSVMKLRRGKPCVKARIIVRLGTDSVNSFRQQIYKSLVSVALKPQNRTAVLRQTRADTLTQLHGRLIITAA
jgi:hypothetical protein